MNPAIDNMIDPKTLRFRVAAAVAGLTFALMLGLPSVSAADSANPDPEEAAAAVYKSVITAYKDETVGSNRRVETQCSGAGPKYVCNWWVIKNRFDRIGSMASDQTPPLLRKGEGEQHYRPSKVKYSGSATATWACTQRNKRNVCKAGSYSVSLK